MRDDSGSLVCVVEVGGHQQVQHSISQELQPLVPLNTVWDRNADLCMLGILSQRTAGSVGHFVQTPALWEMLAEAQCLHLAPSENSVSGKIMSTSKARMGSTAGPHSLTERLGAPHVESTVQQAEPAMLQGSAPAFIYVHDGTC